MQLLWFGIGTVWCLQSCGPADPPPAVDAAPEEVAITNRLGIPPEVVNNLGISFEIATRGRLGVWEEMSGELEVPEARRWTIRAPVSARVVSIVSRWEPVKRGAEIAVLASSDVQVIQQAIARAERISEQALTEMEAAVTRLAESEAHRLEAQEYEEASRGRLGNLLALGDPGSALTAREIMEARGTLTAASKARLDAAIARDDLLSLVARLRLEADQAKLSADAELNGLAMLAGRSPAELRASTEDGAAWERLTGLTQRAPANGVVVELWVSPGEFVEKGSPIALVYDTSTLHFHGQLPEGDLGLLRANQTVRIEFPSRRRPPIETRVERLLPLADTKTRMIRVVAAVPNEEPLLPHGLSVTARVLVEEGASEEVLIPLRCVVYDGLEAIVFRRDPGDPNVVIRTPLELGRRAAGQVEVLAGVMSGDEVVADGIHQLKQSGLGKAPQGGHFHADGSWHEEHE